MWKRGIISCRFTYMKSFLYTIMWPECLRRSNEMLEVGSNAPVFFYRKTNEWFIFYFSYFASVSRIPMFSCHVLDFCIGGNSRPATPMEGAARRDLKAEISKNCSGFMCWWTCIRNRERSSLLFLYLYQDSRDFVLLVIYQNYLIQKMIWGMRIWDIYIIYCIFLVYIHALSFILLERCLNEIYIYSSYSTVHHIANIFSIVL